MAKARRFVVTLSSLALLAISPAVQAQDTDETRALAEEFISIQNDMDEDSAKDAAKKCVALGEKLKTMQGLEAPQRLYFEAEVERCQFFAMNNGKYSDETGDACSHHYAFTSKYAAAVEGWLPKPGVEGEYMASLADQLGSALRIGPEMGCKGDYTAFAATLAAAQELAKKQPRAPDMDFMGEILSVTQGITKDNAKTEIEKCQALKPKFSEKKGLFETETWYYPALIENCLSVAIENGAPPDEDGDACRHLYNHADGLVRTLAAVKGEAQWFEAFAEIYQEDLKFSVAHAKELGCTQDFSALKEQ